MKIEKIWLIDKEVVVMNSMFNEPERKGKKMWNERDEGRGKINVGIGIDEKNKVRLLLIKRKRKKKDNVTKNKIRKGNKINGCRTY